MQFFRFIIVTISLLTAAHCFPPCAFGGPSTGCDSNAGKGMALYRISDSGRTSPAPLQANLLPAFCIDRVGSTPHYYQRDTAFGMFPDSGATYCGPVAVSNLFFWFSRHGFPSLVPSCGDPRHNQHDLICALASSRYMKTGSDGSTVQGLCDGIKHYLQEHKVDGEVTFEGMFNVSREFKSGSEVPDIEKMELFSTGNRAAWLNIGWCTFDAATNTYHRTGGHWVSLIGYGSNGHKEVPGCLVVNDPDFEDATDVFLTTEEITSGTIMNGNTGTKRSAAGYRRFSGSLPSCYGVICGVVYLSLKPAINAQAAAIRNHVGNGNISTSPLAAK